MSNYNLEKFLSERVLQRQQYYDCNSCSAGRAFLANGRSVMPAGTTIYSMPIKNRNDEYCWIKQEYDIAFLFDDMSIFTSKNDAKQVFSFVEVID